MEGQQHALQAMLLRQAGLPHDVVPHDAAAVPRDTAALPHDAAAVMPQLATPQSGVAPLRTDVTPPTGPQLLLPGTSSHTMPHPHTQQQLAHETPTQRVGSKNNPPSGAPPSAAPPAKQPVHDTPQSHHITPQSHPRPPLPRSPAMHQSPSPKNEKGKTRKRVQRTEEAQQGTTKRKRR